VLPVDLGAVVISLPCTHSSFEDQYLDEREAALALEQARQASHIRQHGTLDGFKPAREFPCLGILEVIDRRGPQWVVACNTCRFETTVRSPERPPRERTLDEAKW
jgi:hypothetical protein